MAALIVSLSISVFLIGLYTTLWRRSPILLLPPLVLEVYHGLVIPLLCLKFKVVPLMKKSDNECFLASLIFFLLFCALSSFTLDYRVASV